MDKNSVPKVKIILSTYNGEKYIKELIESVLAQNYSNFYLVIRDDGSTDKTRNILHKYKKLTNVDIFFGENLGVINSFFELLRIAGNDAHYIAFCDQDDIWKKNKITRAVAQLERKVPLNIPGLYFCRYTLVDENLNIISYSNAPYRRPSFSNALVQNIASGCTIVINQNTRSLLIDQIPSGALMYDWWIYLLVSAFGKVIYDQVPSILYRQHNENIIGVRASFFGKWKGRASRFYKRWGKRKITSQAIEFREIFYELMSQEKKNIIDNFIDSQAKLKSRIYYAFSPEVYRQSRIDNIILRILILFKMI